MVLATGALQQPRVPACAAELPANVTQVVAPAYRNPRSLPPGAVLVVGSGETGCQIAEELVRPGRRVYLCGRAQLVAPRRYRGQDVSAWVRLWAGSSAPLTTFRLGLAPDNPIRN